MAFLFCDGFDHYASADILNMWTQLRAAGSGNVLDPDISGTYAKHGAGGLRLRANTINQFSKAVQLTPTTAASGATGVFGTWFRFDASLANILLTSSSSENAALLSVFRAGGTRQLTFLLRADGTISIVRSSQALGGLFSAEATLATSSGALVANQWYWIEFKWTLHESTGSAEVRVNNDTGAAGSVSVSGVDTIPSGGTADWNSITIGPCASASTALEWWYDSVYLLDGSGASKNNFLGSSRVDAQFPTGAGTTANGTRGGADSGANWSQVEETAPNGDTDYVTHAAASDKDTYAYGNLVNAGATIHAVQVCVNARATDAGAASLASVVRHSGTDYVATGQGLSETYAYKIFPYAVNPGTSADWTESNFNSAEFGMQKTA